MSNVFVRLIGPLLGLMIATTAFAGGVDPREMSSPEPVVREQVTATPEQTSTAVRKARQAVAPTVREIPVVREAPVVQERVSTKPRPKTAAPPASMDSWMVGSAAGKCAPLSSVSDKVKNVRFKTPQELGSQLHKRGYQTFVLDIGDRKDQVVRVKVPDLELDLTFVRAGLCR